MVIEELDAGGGFEWEAHVEAHPLSTCYHRLAWRQVAQRAYHLLLYWEILRRSYLRRMAELDFGSSLRGSGSLAFKSGWGARIAPLRTCVLSANGKAPRLSPDEPLASFAVRRWRRLPRRLADAMGPVVCRRWLA